MSGTRIDCCFAPLRLCVSFIFSALILASAGCQTLTPDWSKNWLGFGSPRLKESKYSVPARLAILWSPAVLNQAGQVPTRGFGGRVYFYDSKNQPIAVEGQLVVYAYNNDKPNLDSKVPDRKFAYTPEQFTNHYTPTELGASYSIWIPWDAAGQPQAEISLVPIFTSSSGALVMGQPSRNLLPGPTTPPSSSNIVNCTLPPVEIRQSALTGDPSRRDLGIQQASFQQQLAENQASPSAVPGQPQTTEQGGLSTMSITLPGTMADRLAQAPAQVTLMQKMAMLRQEAMARQSGFAPPTNPVGNALGGVPGSPPLTATASRPQAAGAVPPPWFPTPPPARSVQPSPPALGGPTLPQAVGPPPSQPFPGAQPSYLPGSPQLGPASTVPESWSGALRPR
jgi:hypothetical protein